MVGLSKQTGTCAKEAVKTTCFVLKYVYGRAEVRVLPFKTCLSVKQIVNLEATYYLRLIVQEVAVKSEMGGEKNLEPQVARGGPPVTRDYLCELKQVALSP